ncbi:MAG: DoxX family protein [Gemmatimonadaceae bacterium]
MSAAPFTDTSATSRSSAGGSTKRRWAGRILTGIAVLFLTVDLAMKLAGAKAAVDGTVKLGWQPHHLPILGGLQLVCLVLYLIPRTAPLGAVLWTGYLGGAVATHLRVDDPLFSRILFPVYVAALIWGGLYLRDARVREALRPPR